MQRSSTSVGALAAALAKAQAEIANPEKSLTAIIVSPFPREGSRTFRYASLSSGLDLVRKCMGQHEIATIQATAIEHESGLIKLTTTLVHASGEWVSSDWPVCPVSETVAPHRLGAALTYARRYALFTLVGIAGEDDLDAPDLEQTDGPSALQHDPSRPDRGVGGSHNLSSSNPADPPSQASEKRACSKRPGKTTLSPEASDELRRQLLSELEQLKNAEGLADWVHHALPLKNQLSATDAQVVEVAFTARLSGFGEFEPAAPKSQKAVIRASQSMEIDPSEQTVTVIRKPVRERDREHLKFVASNPCVVCGRSPSDAHHVKFAEQRAMGRKVSDKFTVPICRLHHRELHRRGNERGWWESQGIDPLVIAARLWGKMHALVPAGISNAGDRPPMVNGKLNRRHFGNGGGTTGRPQNGEAKPILRPETE